MAIERPFQVKQSIGIDIDKNIINTLAQARLARRHPRPKNLKFIHADLLDGITWERDDIFVRNDDDDDDTNMDESNGESKNGTVVTMYFVEEALDRIRPMLEAKFAGTNCRIVTNGYAMSGWQPDWIENVLGLPIHLYKMNGSVWNEVQDN